LASAKFEFITTKRVSVKTIKRRRVAALKYINIIDLTCLFLEIAIYYFLALKLCAV
jgi:hypothetical protein